LERETARPQAATAWTNTAAGRACKPTGEATLTLTAATRDQLLKRKPSTDSAPETAL
jgi:hypothetical protein